MSWVSGVTLCTSCVEEDDDDDNSKTWSQVSAWLKDNDLEPLARVEDSASGPKHPQQCIGIGGYNGFREDEFAAFVMSIDWNAPDQVVLIIQSEEGDTRVWRPGGHRLHVCSVCFGTLNLRGVCDRNEAPDHDVA